jgi:hypothetical protein
VGGLAAAGQFRGGEQLVEAQQVLAPGTILAFMEPLYKGGLDGVTPGSSCIVEAARLFQWQGNACLLQEFF